MSKPTGDQIMAAANAALAEVRPPTRKIGTILREALESLPPRATESVPLCRNALAGIEYWFCYHYAGKVSPGTETLDAEGDCGACARVAALTIDSTPPSFMLPEVDL
jgi:hypothetical protein